MDQQQQQNKSDDLPWEDLNKNGKIIEDDIIEKLKRVGPLVYPHQFEFLQYLLGKDIKDQAPIIALKSLTGSGKTLCFQTIIYQNYKPEIHRTIAVEKTMKDGKQKRVLQPYAIVLGNTIFLKQHQEVFEKYLPLRLQEQGMKFQTFFAFSKDTQFHSSENRIEEAQAQVLLCHPSKLYTGIKNQNISCKNLRYLIIDEADQLLSDDSQNMARNDCLNILSFILGQYQSGALDYQIIFVSATLKPLEIEMIVTDAILKNFENDKKIDQRFVKVEGQTKTPVVQIKVLPSNVNMTDKIAPYTIKHFYVEPLVAKQKKLVLADIIEKVYTQFDQVQVMIFFNTKLKSKSIFGILQDNPRLAFLVNQNLIVVCTGNDKQDQREIIRKDFTTQKTKLLLCTDVLQRGLDFRSVRLIVHFGLPRSSDLKFTPEVYLQRSGRTGRAKDEGVVLTILSQKDRKDRKAAFIEALEKNGSKIEVFNEETFLKEVIKVHEVQPKE